MPLDPHILGGRLRVLRLSRGMTLIQLAELSKLQLAFLSRLERDALPYGKLNPETVDCILDALGATPEEREAVYHIEDPPSE